MSYSHQMPDNFNGQGVSQEIYESAPNLYLTPAAQPLEPPFFRPLYQSSAGGNYGRSVHTNTPSIDTSRQYGENIYSNMTWPLQMTPNFVGENTLDYTMFNLSPNPSYVTPSVSQPRTPVSQLSPSTSPISRMSPRMSPSYSGSPHMTPPSTPGSASFLAADSPLIESPVSPTQKVEENKQLYTHRQQLQFFRDAVTLPMSGNAGPFIQQQMYKPHTNSDRRRYVEEVELEAPIEFWVDHPAECGISLSDALHSRVRRLQNREETVFAGRGPSISIRIEWPGYRPWSRQIPTKDFRSPPGPITRAKLAKNVAKCVQRFIEERKDQALEDDTESKWAVGSGENKISLDDLILVSIHHVSLGSWQPQLRLCRPLH